MTLDQLNLMLQQLPQASELELLRLDLQIRLEQMRDRLQLELETEDEVSHLEDPDPTGDEEVPCLAPVNPATLLSAGARKSWDYGRLTHIAVCQAVLLDLLNFPGIIQATQYLPCEALLRGFLGQVPVYLNKNLKYGAALRFENDQGQLTWVEIAVAR